MRTGAFKAAGGFDEGYFMYVEDADLTQKMLQRGQVWLVPQYTARARLAPCGPPQPGAYGAADPQPVPVLQTVGFKF